VLKNIAHVIFGYPSKRSSAAEKKAALKEQAKEEPVFQREAVAPSPRPVAAPVPVDAPLQVVTPVPLTIQDDDKAKAAEALLTVIENGEVKGTVADTPLLQEETPDLIVPKLPVELTVDKGTDSEVVVEQEASNEDKDNEENEDGDDFLSSLFKQEAEKEASAIGLLIATLEDISSHDLLQQADKVKMMMYEWQKKKKDEASNDSGRAERGSASPVMGVKNHGKKR
jgi:hypothetical protein